ncbi:MAG: esterase [Rhodoferax sp.]|nr:esterase [Rhodoferax sp.]
MPTNHLLYLHGFRSSPGSAKARRMAEAIASKHPGVTWWCPQLPPSPKDAMAMVAEGIAAWPGNTMAVVGSSLGGYYATWVMRQTGCKAVLLNPAVAPARDLTRYIGRQTAWHAPEESFYFKAEYVDELETLACPSTPGPAACSRVMAVIARGDEVLDWREMTGRYPGVRVKLIDGGDHALSDFDVHLPDILEFLDLV